MQEDHHDPNTIESNLEEAGADSIVLSSIGYVVPDGDLRLRLLINEDEEIFMVSSTRM